MARARTEYYGFGRGGSPQIEYHPGSGRRRETRRTEEAMRETQRRAAEDRERAMGEITSGREGALSAWGRGEERGVGELTGARGRALEAYGGAEELLRQLLESPESIDEGTAGKMYERGRTGIEAGTQASLRHLSRAYGRGGAPGGSMLREMAGVRAGGVGQLSALGRDIDIERATRKRGDLLSILREQMGLGERKAGIHTGTGQSLADLYEAGARGRAGAYEGAGRSLANLYGRTITKIPKRQAGY